MIVGGWRKLYFKELHNLYRSLGIGLTIMMKSRRMRWPRHVARPGEKSNVNRSFVEKAEGKRPLGRPRCRCEDDITIDVREIGRHDIGWIHLAQDREQWKAVVNMEMNLRVP
jgi:hypothetical protein